MKRGTRSSVHSIWEIYRKRITCIVISPSHCLHAIRHVIPLIREGVQNAISELIAIDINKRSIEAEYFNVWNLPHFGRCCYVDQDF